MGSLSVWRSGLGVVCEWLHGRPLVAWLASTADAVAGRCMAGVELSYGVEGWVQQRQQPLAVRRATGDHTREAARAEAIAEGHKD